MYWANPYNYRPGFQPVWAMTYQQALESIRNAVQGERHDELFYDDLIRMAPTQVQKDIIISIRNDERGHNQMFRGIYKELTGQNIAANANVPYTKPASYIEGLEMALFGELAAVEEYRKIWFGLPAGIYHDTVLGIIMDEQKHASKYNYLFTLNHT